MYYESLKIPNGLSEAVNRRTDNIMAKNKTNKQTNTGWQSTTQRSKVWATGNSTENLYELVCLVRVTYPAPLVATVVLL